MAVETGGIHTRAAVAGAPHGGTLVDLFVESEEDKADLIAGCAQVTCPHHSADQSL